MEQERGLRGKNKTKAIREKVHVMNEENVEQTRRKRPVQEEKERCESRGTGRAL